MIGWINIRIFTPFIYCPEGSGIEYQLTEVTGS